MQEKFVAGLVIASRFHPRIGVTIGVKDRRNKAVPREYCLCGFRSVLHDGVGRRVGSRGFGREFFSGVSSFAAPFNLSGAAFAGAAAKDGEGAESSEDGAYNPFTCSEETAAKVMERLKEMEQKRQRRMLKLSTITRSCVSYYELQHIHNLTKRELTLIKTESSSKNISPGKAANQKELVKLHEKLQEAQAELAATYKSEASSATETLQLVKQVKSLTQELESAKNNILRENAELEKLRKTALEVSVLQDELVRVRTMLSQAENAVRELSGKNQHLVERMVRDKSQMMQEMNQMTEMYEDMKRQLAEERKKNKSSSSSGGLFRRFRNSSDASAGKEGSSKENKSDLQRPFRAMSFGVPLPTRALKSIQAHKSEINSVCFNETGDLLATGSSDGTVGLWHAKEGRQQAILRAASGAASPSPIMCVHMRRGLVLGSGSDRVARVWKIESQRTLHTLTGHTGKVYCARLSPDCRIAITGGTDRKVMIFDMRNGYKMRVINSPSICNTIDINEEGTILASGHQSGDVCLWDLKWEADLAAKSAPEP